jgi:hypothetical protein
VVASGGLLDPMLFGSQTYFERSAHRLSCTTVFQIAPSRSLMKRILFLGTFVLSWVCRRFRLAQVFKAFWLRPVRLTNQDIRMRGFTGISRDSLAAFGNVNILRRNIGRNTLRTPFSRLLCARGLRMVCSEHRRT